MKTDIEIDLSDLKEASVRRICKTLMLAHARASEPQAKRGDEQGGDEEDEGETESEKLAKLHSESHGSPAPLPVKEEDFREGDVRKAIRKLPPKMRYAKKK